MDTLGDPSHQLLSPQPKRAAFRPKSPVVPKRVPTDLEEYLKPVTSIHRIWPHCRS